MDGSSSLVYYTNCMELGFNRRVLGNFAKFVDIVETAMSHSPKSDETWHDYMI